MNKHVEALNNIYNSLPFYDSNKDKYYIGLQFMIYRTKIITEDQCRNKTVLSAEELKLCEPYLDVSTFLNYVSLDNFTDYCLSYTFTARDFTGLLFYLVILANNFNYLFYPKRRYARFSLGG